MPGVPPLKLTGPQLGDLAEALGEAFTPAQFAQMLLYRLDKKLARLAMGKDFDEDIFLVLGSANAQGWIGRLIAAARASNPDNWDLQAFEQKLDAGPLLAADRGRLQTIVDQRSRFQSVTEFLERFGELVTWTCAIEHAAQCSGTGSLIGPDLVLTNYHVVERLVAAPEQAPAARCRFDFKALRNGTALAPGRPVALAADWDVASSPYSRKDVEGARTGFGADELDYAVIRLAEPVGDEPLGDPAKAVPGERKRRWLSAPAAPALPVAGEPLFVLQHPIDPKLLPAIELQPMQLSIGDVQEVLDGGLRLRHDARTLPGSSGSACFDRDLSVVALHHAGDPHSSLAFQGNSNQAIPLREIVRHLQATGHGDIVARAPAGGG